MKPQTSGLVVGKLKHKVLREPDSSKEEVKIKKEEGGKGAAEDEGRIRKEEGAENSRKREKDEGRIMKFASPQPVRPLADTANGAAGMQST
jgi:hypothetical protein